MKVKMLEVFQGTGFEGALLPPNEYEVSDDLAKWLLENGKAVPVLVTRFDHEPEPSQDEPIKPRRRNKNEKTDDSHLD